MNLKEIKLKCRDLFYFYIDVDIASGYFVDYELSFAKLYTYDFRKLSEIEKAVLCFTIIIRREFDEKIEKTAKICYNENNYKLKGTERRFFKWKNK